MDTIQKELVFINAGIANMEDNTVELSWSDIELDKIICFDMGTIWEEVGGQDGMYDNFPIVRIYKDNQYTRCYALDSGGGVAIISSSSSYNQFQIVTLGEDDGYHFLNSSDVYCTYFGSKTDFVHLLSEALSIFNNNVK